MQNIDTQFPACLLTIIAQGLHHDLCLGELIGEADFTGHFAGCVTICIQLLTAATILHHTTFTLFILRPPRAPLRQVDPAGRMSS